MNKSHISHLTHTEYVFSVELRVEHVFICGIEPQKRLLTTEGSCCHKTLKGKEKELLRVSTNVGSAIAIVFSRKAKTHESHHENIRDRFPREGSLPRGRDHGGKRLAAGSGPRVGLVGSACVPAVLTSRAR